MPEKERNDAVVAGQDAGQQQQQQQQQQIQVHVPPELEYHYRDMFNIAVGLEEVVLEFGNRHRTPADRAIINTRIVLSVGNAFRMAQALQQALSNAQRQVQEMQARRGDQPTV